MKGCFRRLHEATCFWEVVARGWPSCLFAIAVQRAEGAVAPAAKAAAKQVAVRARVACLMLSQPAGCDTVSRGHMIHDPLLVDSAPEI